MLKVFSRAMLRRGYSHIFGSCYDFRMGHAIPTTEITMKKFLLLTTAAIALGAAPAVAADLPARAYTKAPPPIAAPIYDWSGFYIGINGGGGSSHKCWDFIDAGLFDPEGCHNATGGTFGGQIGYRWQMASWVFGLEAQGNWADFRGDNISLLAPTLFRNQSRIDSFGLFTGQIGYAWGPALLYVKGGAAVTDDRYRVFDVPTGLIDDRANETRWGATVGVGFEYLITPNLSLGLEYDHMFMGSRDVNFFLFDGTPDFNEHIRQGVDIFLARLNFKFGGYGGPVVARY
jgi:outer membrane immunogenic protein